MARVSEFLYPLPAGIGRLLRLDRLAEPWTITADGAARVLSILGTPYHLARVARSNPRAFIRLLRHLPLAIVVAFVRRLVIKSRAHDEHFRLAAIMGLAQYSGMEDDAQNPFE
jgi:hypothetical protein